jgi:hypothetical protein
MTLEEYKQLTVKKKHKYNAKQAVIDGIKFPSKKHARYYQDLILAKKAGELGFFLMEVPFRLPGGIIYRLDFMEFWKSPLGIATTIKFVEVKGFLTQVARIKLKQVEEVYGIKIEVV